MSQKIHHMLSFQRRDALFDPVTPEDSSFVFAHLRFKESQLRIDSFSKDYKAFPLYVDVKISKLYNNCFIPLNSFFYSV